MEKIKERLGKSLASVALSAGIASGVAGGLATISGCDLDDWDDFFNLEFDDDWDDDWEIDIDKGIALYKTAKSAVDEYRASGSYSTGFYNPLLRSA